MKEKIQQVENFGAKGVEKFHADKTGNVKSNMESKAADLVANLGQCIITDCDAAFTNRPFHMFLMFSS